MVMFCISPIMEMLPFIRYFKFLGMFSNLTLMKEEGKDGVLEMFSFFCFSFFKNIIQKKS